MLPQGSALNLLFVLGQKRSLVSGHIGQLFFFFFFLLIDPAILAAIGRRFIANRKKTKNADALV